MSARCVVRQALQVLQNNGEVEGENDGGGEEGRLGAPADFTLCIRATRDTPLSPLQGIERPHAVQVIDWLVFRKSLSLFHVLSNILSYFSIFYCDESI